jgi:hypothetical protein
MSGTRGFKATAEFASGYVTCVAPYTVLHSHTNIFIQQYNFIALIPSQYSISKVALRDSSITLHEPRSSPVTGLEWPRGFQEVKVPRFNDNGTGWW